MATENIVVNVVSNADQMKPTVDLLVKLGQISAKDAEEFKKLADQSVKLGVESKKAAEEAVKLADVLPGGKKNPKPSQETQKTANAVKSLRTQFAEAKLEVERLTQASAGKLTPELLKAVTAAAKIDDKIKDLGKTLAALNPEAKLTAFLQLGTGISGAFTAAQGAMALFGSESEDVQKAILKVQGALALTQGLNSVLQLKDAFSNLKIVLGVTTVAGQGTAAAIKSVGVALLTNPVTILVAALGTLLGALISTKNEMDKTTKSISEQKEVTQKHTDALFDLETQYLLATGAIDEFDAALRNLELDTRVKELELIAEAEKKAAEEASTWGNSVTKLVAKILSAVGAQGLMTQVLTSSTPITTSYNDKLKEQTDLIADQIKRLKELRDEQAKIIEANRANMAAEKAKEAAEKVKRDAEDAAKKLEALEERNFDNRIKLLEQFYRERELTIRSESDNEDTLTFNLMKNNIDRVNSLIDEFSKKGLDTSALRVEVSKLNDEFKKLFSSLLEAPKNAEEPFKKLQDLLKKIFPDQEFTEKQLQFISDSLKDFGEQAKEIFLNVFDNIAKGFEANAEMFEAEKEARLAGFDEEEERLQELNNNKIISDGAYAQKQKELAKQRETTEKELNKKIAEEKRKAFIAERTASLVRVTIGTAESIVKTAANLGFPLAIPFIAIAAALGAIQASLILSQPIPKFKSGVIGLQGDGTGTSDSIPAMLSKGESVMTAGETRRFEPTLLAIRKNIISPEILNSFAVNHRFGKVEAFMDAGKLTRANRKIVPYQANEIGKSVAHYMNELNYHSPLRQ